MFWKKKPIDRIVERNPRFAGAFGEVYNGLMKDWGAKERFEDFISVQGVVDQLDQMYNSTKLAALGRNGEEVFASVGVQLIDLISKEEVDQRFAWSIIVARDIIFSYGPAVANGLKRDTFEITSLFLSSISDQLSRKNVGGAYQGPILVFGAILEGVDHLK